MTEKEILTLGFEKTYVNDDESQNGYDYYYYQISLSQTLKLSTGQSTWITLFSSQNDGKVDMWTSSFSGHLVR